MIAPCKGCVDRHEACWSNCATYAAWLEETHAKKEFLKPKAYQATRKARTTHVPNVIANKERRRKRGNYNN